MTTQAEPAIKSYFFGKGYDDLLAVLKDSWLRNTVSAKSFIEKIENSGEWYERLLKMAFWGGAGISTMIFGTTIFALISLLHITILVIFFAVIYAGFTLVWLVEKSVLLMRELLVTCPSCHKRNQLPQYFCDNCGQIHSRLMPNSYGIFYHVCKCGQKLPCTFLLNRGRLQARCPNEQCHQMLHRDQFEAKKICLAITGGPYAGKTALMFAIVRQVIESRAAELGFDPEFLDKKNEQDYTQVVEELDKGIVPGKTVASIPKAFNLALKKNGKTQWLLYIYDPSGETYENSDNLTGHHYKEYVDGMVLVIDPFSIPQVRRDYEQQLSKNWNSINPSQLSIHDALTRILLTLEASYGLGKTEKVKKPLAVVLSKVDAFDLEDIIGEKAVTKVMDIDPNQPRQQIRNNIIRQQLADWGESSLLQELDMRFRQVNFFTCSALGRIPDGQNQALSSEHVLEPVNWLLGTVNEKDFSQP